MRYVLEKVLEKEVSEEKLVNLNLIHVASGIKYMTNAAAILLGAMDNCCIKCARFMGDSVLNFIDRKEYSRDLFEQINSAIGFIKSHINLSGFISNGLNVRTFWKYRKVIRKLLLMQSFTGIIQFTIFYAETPSINTEGR